MKKEYIVLILVIVSLSLYLLLRDSGHNIYDVPEMPLLDKETITGISVEGKENSYTLLKKDKLWRLKKSGYKADELKSEKISSVVSTLKLREMIAESKEYDRYNLNEGKELRVKVYAGSSVVREFSVGKAASTHKHTYVRVNDDHRVYLASGSFRNDFDMAAKELRDKLVMSFKKDAVNSISFKENDTILSFSKVEDKKKKKAAAESAPADQKSWVWKFSVNRTGNKEAVEAVINELHSLKCDSYVPEMDKASLTNPFYSITVMTNKLKTISFFNKKDDKSNEYIALSSDNDTPFLISSWKAKKIMKKFDDLKGLKKDKKK